MTSQTNGRTVSRRGNLGLCPVCKRNCYLSTTNDPYSCGDTWLWTKFHHKAEAPLWEETVCYQPTYLQVKTLA